MRQEINERKDTVNCYARTFLPLGDVLTWGSIRKDSAALWSAVLIFETASDDSFILNYFLEPSQVTFSQLSIILLQHFVTFRIFICFRKILLNVTTRANRMFVLCSPFWTSNKCKVVILNRNTDIWDNLLYLSTVDGSWKH